MHNKKLLRVIASICTILMLANPVSAFAADNDSSYSISVDDFGDAEYQYFQQADSRWGSKVYSAGYTIGNTGCMITSIATLMAYANPDLRYVSVMNPKVLSDSLSFSGGAIIWSSAENYDGTFHLVSSNLLGNGGNVKDVIWDALNRGEYLIVYADGVYGSGSGHYSPVVGWDYEKDEPIIQDVASNHYGWSRWEECGVSQIVSYSSDINPSYDVIKKDSSPISVYAIDVQEKQRKEEEARIAEEKRIEEFNKKIEEENKKAEALRKAEQELQQAVAEDREKAIEKETRRRSAIKVEISNGVTRVLS